MIHFDDTITKDEIVNLSQMKPVRCSVCGILTPWLNAIWHSGKQHCSYACVEVTKDREAKDDTYTI